jgi:DNA-binding CsgD family transcriptional regulator
LSLSPSGRVKSKASSRLGITMTVSMGIPGLDEIRAGTHICVLYSGPVERDALLFPYLRAGIRNGDKCLCLIDDAEPALVRDQVVNGDRPRRSEHLDVDRVSDAYLQAGRFSVEHMMSFLSGRLSDAESEFPMLRAAGDMSWVLPQPEGAQDFFAYESAINKIIKGKPAVFMCMYDILRCGVSTLVDLIKTHPKVLLDGMVLNNPDYLRSLDRRELQNGSAPTKYALATVPKARTGRAAASDPWWSLTDAELRIAELVAGGLTNRNIAEYLNLSPHTVDAHLKHAYTKLNIHSRVELAVLALEHR